MEEFNKMDDLIKDCKQIFKAIGHARDGVIYSRRVLERIPDDEAVRELHRDAIETYKHLSDMAAEKFLAIEKLMHDEITTESCINAIVEVDESEKQEGIEE